METRDSQVAPGEDVCVSLRNKTDAHLRRDDIICHVPEPGLHVRSVGEGEAFHFGGDGADDRIVLLVGLPHHANVPATTRRSEAAAIPTVSPPHSFTYPTTYSRMRIWMNLNTHPTRMLGMTSVFDVS